jgi:hypothetical protein
VLKQIQDILQSFWQFVKPAFDAPTAYSWQGLARLTLFSFIVAVICWALDIYWVQEFASMMCQIFLIFTVQWWGIHYNFKLIHWVTGALVSVLFFGNITGEITQAALITWPLFSGIIAVLPDFTDRDLEMHPPKPQKRPSIVTLLSTQALISCWLQLLFVIQTWTEDYPALLSDDLDGNVVAIELETRSPQGVEFLNAIEAQLKATLVPLSWPEVQKWLQPPNRFDNLREVVVTAAREHLTPLERALWNVEYQLLNQASGYRLQFTASWDGPQSSAGAPSHRKICQIRRVFGAEDDFQTAVVVVDCDRAQKLEIPPNSEPNQPVE